MRLLSCLGDTIVLQAGATYATRVTTVNSYGPQGYPFLLPNKSCATGQYVTIQTSQAASLPTGRISPSNIGLMDAGYKQQCLGHRSGPRRRELSVHWHRIHQHGERHREQGIQPDPGYGLASVHSLWKMVSRHGLRPRLDSSLRRRHQSLRHDAVGRLAIRLDGANQTIKNSYISGFCCFQSDTPTVVAQSEGIAIPTGPGPYTITNNFVEAFRRNIFTGGAGAFQNPANRPRFPARR